MAVVVVGPVGPQWALGSGSGQWALGTHTPAPTHTPSAPHFTPLTPPATHFTSLWRGSATHLPQPRSRKPRRTDASRRHGQRGAVATRHSRGGMHQAYAAAAVMLRATPCPPHAHAASGRRPVYGHGAALPPARVGGVCVVCVCVVGVPHTHVADRTLPGAHCRTCTAQHSVTTRSALAFWSQVCGVGRARKNPHRNLGRAAEPLFYFHLSWFLGVTSRLMIKGNVGNIETIL